MTRRKSTRPQLRPRPQTAIISRALKRKLAQRTNTTPPNPGRNA